MIREARPADRPAIERLQRHLVEPVPDLLDDATGGRVLVSTAPASEHESRVAVGYLLWFPGTPVYVAELAVAPDYRREGRGGDLFRALFDRLPRGTAVELRVAAENDGAQALYRELCFERVATEADAYESGAGYLMRTVIEPETDPE